MARVQYKGKIQRTMAQYEALTTLEDYADYDLTDHPNTYITNAQMTFALNCVRLFPAGDTYICSDTGAYTQGHTYKIKVTDGVKSWEDITPSGEGGSVEGVANAQSYQETPESGVKVIKFGKIVFMYKTVTIAGNSEEVWNFPIAFTNTPACWCNDSGSGSSANNSAAVTSTSTLSMTVRVCGADSQVTMFALGWKE